MTTLMPLALSICVLFTLLMQSVNEIRFLKYYILFLLFEAAAVLAFGIGIVPLTCMFAPI